MGGASQVLLNNFSLNFVNKFFVVFCFPQFEGTEFRRQTKEEEGVEPQTAQDESLPTPPIDSDANCEESEDITFVSPLESIATPFYAHSVNEPLPATITQGQEAVM